MKHLLLALLLLGALAHPLAAQSPIFLVRHAEKADVSKDPDLSPAGRARAEALAVTLKSAGIRQIFVTEFKRTQQTAKPMAKAGGIEVKAIPANDLPVLVSLLQKAEHPVLVVGHSNTVPEIIKALGISGQITLKDSDYDNLFVVTPRAKRELIRLHYR